jgi:RHS repeat-associated protein
MVVSGEIVSGENLYRSEFQRDKLGRIVEKTETLGGVTRTWQYDYDLAGRLTDVRRNGTTIHLYDYDANGNRTSHTGPAGTRIGIYDAQDRVTEYGDATYSHTPAGERSSKTTSQGRTTYDYDAAGNLRAVNLPDGTEIEYLIDGQDRRVGKVVDGILQKGWLYQDQLNPVAQLDATGAVTHRFVYADKPNVPAYMIKDGTPYRIVSDHLGSVRLVIDTDTNEIVQRLDYSPFGKVIADTNPGFQPFGFAGGLYDVDTGLVRFGARDYDPEIGRWTAKDPILFQGDGTNLYGYAIGDPVNLVDMNGLQAGRAPANSGTYPGLRGLPQGMVNFSAGFGDTMSFGLTADIRAANGIDGGVDPCSNAYAAGRYSAYGAAAAAGGAAAARYGPAAARAAFSKLPGSVQAAYAGNAQRVTLAVQDAIAVTVPGAPPGTQFATAAGAAKAAYNYATGE